MTNRHTLKFSILAAAILALCLPAERPPPNGGVDVTEGAMTEIAIATATDAMMNEPCAIPFIV